VQRFSGVETNCNDTKVQDSHAVLFQLHVSVSSDFQQYVSETDSFVMFRADRNRSAVYEVDYFHML